MITSDENQIGLNLSGTLDKLETSSETMRSSMSSITSEVTRRASKIENTALKIRINKLPVQDSEKFEVYLKNIRKNI